MFTVLSFYKFHRLTEAQLGSIQENLERFADAHDLRGLVILAEEGINATVAGSATTAEQFRTFIHEQLFADKPQHSLEFKESRAEKQPFRRFRVKVRPEIVTLGRSDIDVAEHESALSPAEWHLELQGEESYVLLDTRNAYETKLGMFRGAIDPQLSNFAELSSRLHELGIPKDKKVLMYCTGGIRCEKALPLLKSEGYERVYQLAGGILNYMEQYPEGFFEGECFVFDHRVSVDSQLQPSERYALCPLCGMPSESVVSCGRCRKERKVCGDCIAEERNFCSIRCENEFRFEASRPHRVPTEKR